MAGADMGQTPGRGRVMCQLSVTTNNEDKSLDKCSAVIHTVRICRQMLSCDSLREERTMIIVSVKGFKRLNSAGTF